MVFRLAAQRLQDLLIGFLQRARSKNALQSRPFRHPKGFDRSQANQALGTGQAGDKERVNVVTRGQTAQSPHRLVAAKRWVSIVNHRLQGRQQALGVGGGWVALVKGEKPPKKRGGKGGAPRGEKPRHFDELPSRSQSGNR